MNRAAIGWIWVGGQVVVIGALMLLPGRQDWPTPGWVEAVATVLFFGGFAIVGIAALGLGTSLTPTPVPRKQGELTTGGFYRYVRHPIYTGVLAIIAGMTLRSGSWIHFAIGILAVVFFDRKAAWEERQLTERFPNYPDYAKDTPKFIPQPWRKPRSR